MNPFRAAVQAAQAVLTAVAGVTVTLTRGATETEDVPAVPGRTLFTTEDSDGQRYRRKVRDFLIDASAYTFADVATEPRAGDLITETFPDDSERVWEVQPPAPGGEPWQWSDESALRYRIHTIDVTEPA
jgi:hypothetical protein